MVRRFVVLKPHLIIFTSDFMIMVKPPQAAAPYAVVSKFYNVCTFSFRSPLPRNHSMIQFLKIKEDFIATKQALQWQCSFYPFIVFDWYQVTLLRYWARISQLIWYQRGWSAGMRGNCVKCDAVGLGSWLVWHPRPPGLWWWHWHSDIIQAGAQCQESGTTWWCPQNLRCG